MILSYKSLLLSAVFLFVAVVVMIPTGAGAVEQLTHPGDYNIEYIETERIITEREVAPQIDDDTSFIFRLVHETDLRVRFRLASRKPRDCDLTKNTKGRKVDFTYKGIEFQVCMPDGQIITPIYYGMINDNDDSTPPVSFYDIEKDESNIFKTIKKGRDVDATIALVTFDNANNRILGASYSDNGYASVNYSYEKTGQPPCVVIFVGYEKNKRGFSTDNGLFHQESDCNIKPLHTLSNKTISHRTHAIPFRAISLYGDIYNEGIIPILNGHNSLIEKIDGGKTAIVSFEISLQAALGFIENQKECIHFAGKRYDCEIYKINAREPISRREFYVVRGTVDMPSVRGHYTAMLIGLDYMDRNKKRHLLLNIQTPTAYFDVN